MAEKILRYAVAQILWFLVDTAITSANLASGTYTRPMERPKWRQIRG